MKKINKLALVEGVENIPLTFYFVSSMADERKLSTDISDIQKLPNDDLALLYYQTRKKEIYSFYKPIRLNFKY